MITKKPIRTRLVVAAVLALLVCAAAPRAAAPETALPAADPNAGAAAAPAAAPPPPIEWLPWSDAVFERARKERKPILLNVVSRWCRPCLVSDREVYSDPIVRRLVERLWIPVRVDRDERPDIDQRYQVALNAYNRGMAGYPVTAFLFPSGEAMWAGLFVPLDETEASPGMRNLLIKMDEFWHMRFPEAQKNAQFVESQFRDEAQPRRENAPAADILSAIIDGTVARNDHEHGGYGPPPRVTNPFDVRLVLLASQRRRDEGLREQALRALRAPIDGALMDHLGGGFHRAARDADWALPWFDKPLTANAAYLLALADAVRLSGDAALAGAAGSTVDYILGALASPEGGYYVGQAPSADPDDESAYYAFRVDEVKALVAPADLPWARLLFGLRDDGEVSLGLPPRIILRATMSPAEAAKPAGASEKDVQAASARILGALAKARAARPRPPVAPERYLDSTSLTCSALLNAGMVLGRRDAVASALKSLDAILSGVAAVEKGIPHRLGSPAEGGEAFSPVLMSDHAFLGAALLDAYAATGEPRYLDAARKVSAAIWSLFYDEEWGGFFDIVPQAEPRGYLRFRRKVAGDSLSPSPQAAALRFLDRLATLSQDVSWKERLEKSVSYAATRIAALDQRGSSLGLALDAWVGPALRVSVAGEGSPAEALVSSAWRIPEPGLVIERRPAHPGKEASATVCAGDRCREGVSDPAALAAALASVREAPRGGSGSVAAPRTLW